MAVNFTPLKSINSNVEFWRGTKIRMMHHGDMHPNDQHFDYMLVKVPEDKEHMILVNVTEGSHKAGAVFVKKVSIQITSNKIVVKLEALKEALGESFDYCYLIT